MGSMACETPECSDVTSDAVTTTSYDLPLPLLQRILHASGRATRRVCRHWRATYGPLRGLLLTGPTSDRDILALPPHVSSIRALALAASSLPPPPPRARRAPNPRSIPAALPRTFPCLASLDLDTILLSAPNARPRPLTPHLQSLAPLAPHVTALTFRNIVLSDQPLTALPTALPTLRSLTLAHAQYYSNHTPAIVLTINTLRALSHLQHLAMHRPGRPGWEDWEDEVDWEADALTTADILPPLAALPPTLTHLDFQVSSLAPDHTPQDLLPLHAALPNLRALRLALTLSFWEPTIQEIATLESSLHTLTTALSQRQALTSIHLDVAFSTIYALLYNGSHLTLPAHLARLRSLRSLHLRLDFQDFGFAGTAMLQRLALAAPTSLTSLSLNMRDYGPCDAAPRAPPLAALWRHLASTLLHLDWDSGLGTYAQVASLAPLTALQSLSLPESFDLVNRGEVGGKEEAVEALLSLIRLTRLVAVSALHTEFSSALLAGIGRLPALRQLVVAPDDSAQAGPASASSSLTRVELECGGVCRVTCCMARVVAALPLSVRCLALPGERDHISPSLAQQLGQQGGGGLLPLPRGLRVLALGSYTLQSLSGQARAALEAAARQQDCALVGELPAEERHFGCNGYL